MIIRDDRAKSGDKHEQDKARSNGEELHIDLGRDLTEDEQKIFEKLREGLHMSGKRTCPHGQVLFHCGRFEMKRERSEKKYFFFPALVI